MVYKKAVLLFRRVFTQARLLPVWRLRKRLAKVKLNSSLKLRVRVVAGDPTSSSGRVRLNEPLVEMQSRENVTDVYNFGRVDTPAGYTRNLLFFSDFIDFLMFLWHIELKQILE